MILSMDWKLRLEKDTRDFFESKLPKGDYDIDLVYNAFPERQEGKVPRYVVSHVAKLVAQLIGSKIPDYLDFYRYLWDKKDENGRLILAEIFSRGIKKHPNLILDILYPWMEKSTNPWELGLFFDKIVYVHYKKEGLKNNEWLMRLYKNGTPVLKQQAVKMWSKLFKNDSTQLRPFFAQLQSRWLSGDEDTAVLGSELLKAAASLDEEFYLEIWQNYRNTREPAFAEILANAVKIWHPVIDEALEFWAGSGNVRLKKAGVNGLKQLKRYKKAD